MNSVSAFRNESGAQTGFFPILLSVYTDWIRIRLFPLNKKLLEARPRRPGRRWTAGLCLTRRVTIREIQRLSYESVVKRLSSYDHESSLCLLSTFELDVIFAERNVGFSPQLLSVSTDYSRCSARGRPPTLLVPSSQWDQRSVFKGIELEFVHYRSLLNNKVCIHQLYMRSV